MFMLPTLKYLHLLEAKKHASLVPTFSLCQCSRKKTMKVCVALRSKCVDKCTYALITILSISKGNVHTQVHNSTVVFFNCEWEEYSLYGFFPHVHCFPALSVAFDKSGFVAYTQWFDHTHKTIHFSQALLGNALSHS